MNRSDQQEEKKQLMNKLIPVITFIFGILTAVIFIEPYNGDVLELFQAAYESGKTDGFALGHSSRSITDFEFYQKESLCTFLYAEEYKR